MDEISRAVGSTPLIKLEKLSDETGASVYVKYEASNPGSSIKDRPARFMIDGAEARGWIAPGKSTIVEPTSGNTGIALAMIGAVRGYEVILVMPESMSKERRMLLAAYGAQVELTPAAQGIAGSVRKASEIADRIADACIIGQFSNPDNPLAHEVQTGPEILDGLGKAPDCFVAGVGTGGTISGIAHFFKERGDKTRFFAVEPAESPLITQSLQGDPLVPGAHGIQGIGANFIPDTLDIAVLDGALSVSTEEAMDQARWMAKEEGLLVGISSGANIAAIRKLTAEQPQAEGKVIVTVAADSGERYLSTSLFEGAR